MLICASASCCQQPDGTHSTCSVRQEQVHLQSKMTAPFSCQQLALAPSPW